MIKSKKILALANYIWKSYPIFSDRTEFWKLLSLLDRNEDKIVFIENGYKLCGAAFYLRLSDDNFLKVLFGGYDLKNSDDLDLLLKDSGRNIHILSVVSSNMRFVLRGLKKMIRHEKPSTVSWFKPSMDKIHIVYLERSNELCQKIL